MFGAAAVARPAAFAVTVGFCGQGAMKYFKLTDLKMGGVTSTAQQLAQIRKVVTNDVSSQVRRCTPGNALGAS